MYTNTIQCIPFHSIQWIVQYTGKQWNSRQYGCCTRHQSVTKCCTTSTSLSFFPVNQIASKYHFITECINLSLFVQDTKVSDSAQPELHCMSFQTWYQMSQHSFITQNTSASFQTIQFDKTSKCHPPCNTIVSQQNLASVLLYLGPCIYVHVRAMQNINCALHPNKTQPRKVSVCCTPDSGPLHLAQKF